VDAQAAQGSIALFYQPIDRQLAHTQGPFHRPAARFHSASGHASPPFDLLRNIPRADSPQPNRQLHRPGTSRAYITSQEGRPPFREGSVLIWFLAAILSILHCPLFALPNRINPLASSAVAEPVIDKATLVHSALHVSDINPSLAHALFLCGPVDSTSKTIVVTGSRLNGDIGSARIQLLADLWRDFRNHELILKRTSCPLGIPHSFSRYIVTKWAKEDRSARPLSDRYDQGGLDISRFGFAIVPSGKINLSIRSLRACRKIHERGLSATEQPAIVSGELPGVIGLFAQLFYRSIDPGIYLGRCAGKLLRGVSLFFGSISNPLRISPSLDHQNNANHSSGGDYRG
jgi:hypothetical protein